MNDDWKCLLPIVQEHFESFTVDGWCVDLGEEVDMRAVAFLDEQGLICRNDESPDMFLFKENLNDLS